MSDLRRKRCTNTLRKITFISTKFLDGYIIYIYINYKQLEIYSKQLKNYITSINCQFKNFMKISNLYDFFSFLILRQKPKTILLKIKISLYEDQNNFELLLRLESDVCNCI